MWGSWLSSCRPRRFGVPWAAFCVAALLVPAFTVSAHAQTHDILLSNKNLHVKDGNWYLLEDTHYHESYTVKLKTQPTHPVDVMIQEVDQNGTPIENPLLVLAFTVTLVPSNPTPGHTHLWSTGASVPLSAIGDDGNSTDETVRIKHSASSSDANYNGKEKTQIVTEVDNDRVVLLTPTKVTVPEGGTSTYTAKLKSQPTGNVTVTVARKSGGDTNLTVKTGASLTFTTENYDTAQTVTLQAAEDNDNLHGSAVFTHTPSGADYTEPGATLTAATLTAVENDNDNGLKLSVASLSVPENETKTYTVALNAQPTDDVTVTVARKSGGDTDLSVQSGGTLTFTTENYSTAQTVTLKAAVDADDAHGSAEFTHTASDGGYNGVSATLTATEVDKRAVTFGFSHLYPITGNADMNVNEGGTAYYTVSLADKPTADVTVTVTHKSGDTDLSVQSGGTLTFTPTNYSMSQNVTLSAAKDDDYYVGIATFTHTAGGAWTGARGDITAAEKDSEKDKRTPKLLPLPTKLATHPLPFLGTKLLPVAWIPEGETKSLPVTLATRPRPNETVTVTVSKTRSAEFPGGTNDPDLTAAPATLTFTSTNWNTPQTVTLSAAEECDAPPCSSTEDDILDGSAGVKFAATSNSTENPKYDGQVTLWVHEADNDNTSRALTLSATSVAVPEGGEKTYTVKLASEPDESVTVTVARKSGDEHDTDLSVQSGGSLTFTTDNWDTAQTVTLSAADDEDNVNGTAVFTHIPDGAWIIASKELTATEADKDLVSGTVPEPVPVTFGTRTIEDQTYVLDAPIAALTLPAATGGGGNVSYALSGTLPAGLTFDPATRVLTGTPTALQGAVSYTYTATAGNVTATLTFTIAVERDTLPVFVNEDPTIQLVANQAYTLNAAIPALTLPEATGGNPPITYALALAAAAGTQGRTQAATGTDAGGDSSTLPAGLTFDPATRTLSGTPTALQSPRLYVYTATDYNGDQAKLEFTIAVETDREATFGDRTIGPQTYVQHAAIQRRLPQATDGNGVLTYALSGTLPAGLTFDPATRVLTGTPTEQQPATRYTYTVTDVDGDTAELTFTITILVAAEKEILKDMLAAQGRALLSSATGVIGERFRRPGVRSGGVLGACTGTAFPGGARASPEEPPAADSREEGGDGPRRDRAAECLSGILDTIANELPTFSGGGALGKAAADEAPWRSRGPDVTRMGSQPAWNWESLVWGRSFALPLKTPASPESAWTLWGAGDVQGFQGSPRQGSYDGQVRSLYLGLDKRWSERWLAGAALAQSWGETDYVAGDDEGSTGQVETRLTSLYPYVRGAFESGLEVWAIGGYGRGEAENTRQGEAGAAETSDLSMAMGATGARQPMTEWGRVQVALVGGAGYVTLVTDAGGPVVGDLNVAVHRGRLAVEATGQYEALTPYVQVGGRYDGGAGQTGAGLETVAGVRYASERLEFEARGRWLATHAAEGYAEYGGLARLAVKPQADGTGFRMAVAPRWGAAEGSGLLGGGETLLGGGAVPGAGVNGVQPAGNRVLTLQSQVGYGFAVFDRQGVLTPYGGFALTGAETHRYRLGGRLGMAQWLNLSLEGSRSEGTGQQPADQGVQLTLQGRF